jgi:hypothetical protein
MPPLPTSLSPHVCVLTSPDLDELLSASSLPPLPQILQSFSPLPQGMFLIIFHYPIPVELFYYFSNDSDYITDSCSPYILYASFLRPRRDRGRMQRRRRATCNANNRLDKWTHQQAVCKVDRRHGEGRREGSSEDTMVG